MEARPLSGVLPVKKTDTPSHRSFRPALLFVGLLISVFLTYYPALHGDFLWDDNAHVTDNAALYRQPNFLIRLWSEPRLVQQYYPLTYTVFALEYRAWGEWTPGYHIVNILLHTLNAFLLASLLCLFEIPGAWLAAFLFALHPVCVESVAWISELKNVLSTAFFLAAIGRYWRFEKQQKARDYAIAFFLYIAALFSKTVTCTFPGVILVLLWWKNGRLRLRDFLSQLPFILVGAGLGLETASLEKSSIGATGAAWVLSPWQHIVLAARIVWFYAAKIVWPHPLIFFYPRWTMNETFLWIYPVVLLGVLIFLGSRAYRGQRGFLAAALLFIGMLVPALGFINVYPMRYSYVADHFQYLACLPLIVLAAAWLQHWRPSEPRLWTTCMAILCIGVAFISRGQAAAYRSSFALWQDTAEKNPHSAVVLTNWATELMKSGQDADAMAALHLALTVDPLSVEAMENLAEEYHQAGHFKEAIALYQSAIQIQPAWPGLHYRLADVWKDSGNTEQAATEYENVLRLMPAAIARAMPYAQQSQLQSIEAHARDNLAEHLVMQHQYAASEDQLNKALLLDPQAAPLHQHRGLVLLKEGKTKEAMAEFTAAHELDPQFAVPAIGKSSP